jgi:hypothetical protein
MFTTDASSTTISWTNAEQRKDQPASLVMRVARSSASSDRIGRRHDLD